MAELFTLPTFTDSRGSLTVLERYLPFEIQRVYWMHHLSGEERAGHRHLITTQALICLQGECEVHIKKYDQDEIFLLNKPDIGLILLPEDWHLFKKLTKESMILVMASHPYDPSDYHEKPL